MSMDSHLVGCWFSPEWPPLILTWMAVDSHLGDPLILTWVVVDFHLDGYWFSPGWPLILTWLSETYMHENHCFVLMEIGANIDCGVMWLMFVVNLLHCDSLCRCLFNPLYQTISDQFLRWLHQSSGSAALYFLILNYCFPCFRHWDGQ